MKIQISIHFLGLFLFKSIDTRPDKLYHFNKWLKTTSGNKGGFYTFDWLFKVSIKQCSDVCILTKACQYINYQPRPHLCSLIRNDTDSTPIVETKPGYLFGNKSEWTKSIPNDCKECPNKGQCIEDKSLVNRKDECRNSGCGKPDGADIQGNMFGPEDKVLQRCKFGHEREPSTAQGDQTTCSSNNGTWRPFTCKRAIAFKGSYYFVQNEQLSWIEAKEFCESKSGFLVDIKTEEEQRFVESLIDAGSYPVGVWTGGNDLQTEGTFQWLDNTYINAGFMNWIGTNQGFSGNGGEDDCMHVSPKSMLYKWVDLDCSITIQSICEFQ